MTDTFFHIFEDRAVVAVGGPDAGTLLGDLVTGDVVALDHERAGYAALLTPQGKVLFDFLVFRDEDRFLLDTPADSVPALVQRLTLYKLRSNVDISPLRDARVVAAWGEHVRDLPGLVPDPRLADLGARGILAPDQEIDPVLAAPSDAAAYHAWRIALAVPEAGADFEYGGVFPHDVAMDVLGGVDFRKGCYVGQEVVSRMQHRGTARRRIVAVTSQAPLPAAGTTLTDGERQVGILGSTSGVHGIAIVRLDRAGEARQAGRPIDTGGVPVTLEIPAWASYGWPEADG